MEQEEKLKQSIDFIYNPDNQTKCQLIDGFVVRLKTFERLFSDIKQSSMKSPEQHYLVEGKRGMGKTTLLLRMGYEIENDGDLNSWLIPIVFNEEEYSIRRLYKLWERVASLLEDKHDDNFNGLFNEMDSSFSKYESEEDYEYGIFNLLNNLLEKKQKKLILFIDNFGDIFLKFNKQEVQRLRTVLQSSANFRIIGASSSVLEVFYDNKHPFFEFFKVIRLKGLDKEETQDLLLKLGESYKEDRIKEIIQKHPGRIEALRRLTGGVVRTIVILSEIFIDQKQGNAFSDLESILDKVTPLYKHRMDDLPAQQQEIVAAIAMAWDAINVSEISQKTKIISKTVSAQLRQMEKNELITKKLSNNKNHYYQISERFFNIWYLMRHGRKGDKKKILWLVRFFEEWCDESELILRAQKHIGMLNSKSYNTSGAYYLTEALASTKDLPLKNQDELIKATRIFLSKKNSEFADQLSSSDVELFDKAVELYDAKDYKIALSFFLKTKKKDNSKIAYCYGEINNFTKAEKHYLMEIDNENVMALNNLAIIYQREFIDLTKAEKYFLMAVEKGDLTAMNNLALFYINEIKDFTKAEEYYLMAVEKGDFGAMNNLAGLYENEFRDFTKAEEYYLMAIEKGDSNSTINLAILYEEKFEDFTKAEEYYLMAIENGDSRAMNNLTVLYGDKLKDLAKAEKYALMAIENGDLKAFNNLAIIYENEYKDFIKAEEYYLKAIEKGYFYAINNLGSLYYNKLNDFTKAEKYYLMAIEKGNSKAMVNLAILYAYDFNDFEKAEKYYLMAIEKGSSKGMNNLAIIYENEFKDYKKAEEYYLMAIEKGDLLAMNNLASLFRTIFKDFTKAEEYYLMAIEKGDLNAMNNLAVLYENEFKDFTKAEKYFLMAVEKGDSRAMNNLAVLYENEFKDFTKAEKYYLMAVEKGDSKAMNNLALIYKDEYEDFTKAEEYFLLAVEKGDSKAMINLGQRYFNIENFTKAEEYFLMANEKGDSNALSYLGSLYFDIEDFTKAEEFYLASAENMNFHGLNNLAYLYYFQKRNKTKALNLAEKAYIIDNQDATQLTYAKNLLWCNKIDESKDVAKQFMYNEKFLEEYRKYFIDYILLLLAKKQYQYLYDYFNNPKEEHLKIKDKLKPIWYVLMYYLQNEHPNEYLRMGDEFEETVKEINDTVQRMRIEYA